MLTLVELSSNLPTWVNLSEYVKDSNYYNQPAVQVPYKDKNGKIVGTRYRIALQGDRFRWEKNSKLLPYGVWRPQEEYVVLVEGESDCWALWSADIPALGIPGKSTWKREWARYLPATVYYWQEPDAKDLASKLLGTIPNLKIIIPPEGVKDPLDLARQCSSKSDFVAKMTELMAAATTLPTDPVLALILPKYSEGNRQEIILGLSGLLKKAGWTQEETTRLCEKICMAAEDKELRKRLDAVNRTYRAEIVAGPSLLAQVGINPQDIIALVSKEEDRQFRISGNILYRVFKDDAHMIGPAVDVECRLLDDNDIKYLVKWDDRKIALDISEIKNIEKFTGVGIISEAKYKEWFSRFKSKPIKTIRRATGWANGRFWIPGLDEDDVYWEHSEIEKFIRVEPEAQHELIKNLLRGGGMAGSLVVVSVATPFLGICDGDPALVLLTGSSTSGKTLAATLAANIWYYNKQPYTTHATATGIELLLSSLKGLPVLFDEAGLLQTDMELLAFLVQSRRGKTRGNRNLQTRTTSLESHLIITSEIAEAEKFRRTGARRRTLCLHAADWKDITTLSMDDCIKSAHMCGCGLDFLLYINPETVRTLLPVVKKDLMPKSMAKVFLPLWLSLRFLQNIYNERFEATEEALLNLANDHITVMDERLDVCSNLLDQLRSYISTQPQHFIGADGRRDGYGDLYGKLDNTYADRSKLTIASTIFKKFCMESGIDVKSALQRLAEAGLLQYSGTAYRTTHRLLPHLPPISTYVIFLPTNIKLDDVPF